MSNYDKQQHGTEAVILKGIASQLLNMSMPSIDELNKLLSHFGFTIIKIDKLEELTLGNTTLSKDIKILKEMKNKMDKVDNTLTKVEAYNALHEGKRIRHNTMGIDYYIFLKEMSLNSDYLLDCNRVQVYKYEFNDSKYDTGWSIVE